MMDLIKTINTIALPKEKRDISFYERYINLSKEYEKLIKDGYTRPRGKILMDRNDGIFPIFNSCNIPNCPSIKN